MMKLYEKNGITVKERMISQYLQNKKIAKDFTVYYDLFNKYKSDYQVDKILSGENVEVIKGRARHAKFDERLSLLGLLLDASTGHLKNVCNEEKALSELLNSLKAIRAELAGAGGDALKAIDTQISEKQKALSNGRKSGSMSEDDQFAVNSTIRNLEADKKALLEKQPENAADAFKLLKTDFDRQTVQLKAHAEEAGKKLSNMFAFCDDVYGDGQEMVILVTELTISYYGSRFISRYGCKEYFEHNKELLFYERQKEIIAELENLEL